jgi:CheY-like chemotaxis protein
MACVLVVDDDAGFRTTVSRMLSRLGHEVWLADGGEAALSLLRTRPADVVLMDIFMPGTDGVEATQRLVRLRPRTPVVATSGGGVVTSEVALRLAGRVGAFSTLPKPFTLGELRDALARVLPPPSRTNGVTSQDGNP